MSKDTSWDHGLSVAADADGLVGHAGAVLLRKVADQCGLTAALGPALARAGRSPLIDRGMALVPVAVAIALGATSMNDITLLDHLAPVFGAPPSDTTVRRTLELAGEKTLARIAKARARIRSHVWSLIAATAAGFPWLVIAGKTLRDWVIIDMDATLITAHSEKEGAAPTFKMGFGFHPLAAWCANTRECLAMLMRGGNAGSNTVKDHIEVLAAAIAQVPARSRRQLLVRTGGAGAARETITHLMKLNTRLRTVRFTCGWAITKADEAAIKLLPASAWGAAVGQDGAVQKKTAVAEITHLMSRADGWNPGLRWIVRRTKPSRRQMKNLTAYEKATGWRYSIIVTNIPDAGLEGVPGSGSAQFTDVLHRQHAVVEDKVRTNKAAGLRNLPSIIFSPTILRPSELWFCVVDSVVHGTCGGSSEGWPGSFCSPFPGRVVAGERIVAARCSPSARSSALRSWRFSASRRRMREVAASSRRSSEAGVARCRSGTGGDAGACCWRARSRSTCSRRSSWA
jgi:hypothetical protein